MILLNVINDHRRMVLGEMALCATIAGHGCRLTICVIGYQFPNEHSDPDDANWLEGEARLEAGTTGRFSARHKLWLRADELHRFNGEMRDLDSSLSGTATLRHLESQVGCTVKLTSGRGKLSAFLKEHNGSELRVRDCDTDQSYVAGTLRELDAILAAFPVRATHAEPSDSD